MNKNNHEAGGPLPERDLTPFEFIRKGYEDAQDGDKKSKDEHSAIPLKEANSDPNNPLNLLKQGYAQAGK